jgi:hypothetical protein
MLCRLAANFVRSTVNLRGAACGLLPLATPACQLESIRQHCVLCWLMPRRSLDLPRPLRVRNRLLAGSASVHSGFGDGYAPLPSFTPSGGVFGRQVRGSRLCRLRCSKVHYGARGSECRHQWITGSRWCGRGDSNPHRHCCPTDFLTSYGFRRPRRPGNGGGFVVWTIPSPCSG